ncbi:hypothetical protein CVT24_000158 [Panaeolus cyanescens]|uniref:Protein kinase domain-containing protein n=1 Tax=Panaeolus cyanescens TaxID=181874 RepID=A0A409VIU3_9AGAR|nr:hypothetical protein CVT24_000158 [Panaeolus cyanescens]
MAQKPPPDTVLDQLTTVGNIRKFNSTPRRAHNSKSGVGSSASRAADRGLPKDYKPIKPPKKAEMTQGLQSDLEGAIPCKATDLMNYLFSFCSTTEGEVLLLKAELQYVFSEVQKLVGNNKKLQELFEAVPNIVEGDMYGPLIIACNYAFYLLSTLNVAPLPDYNEKTQLVMIRRDSTPTQPEQEDERGYKPDLCIVFWEWIRQSTQGYDITFKETNPIWEKILIWRNMLCPVEVKPATLRRLQPSPAGAVSDTTDFWSLNERRVVWQSNQKPAYAPVTSNPVSLTIDKVSTRSRTNASSTPVNTWAHQAQEVGSSKKRKTEDAPNAEPVASKRAKTSEHTVTSKEDDRAQLALYSAHRLSSFFDITHTFSMLLRGSTVLLHWSDRQGVVESYEFDYVQNLPHFIFLLLVLQRFSPARWGYGTEATPSLNNIDVDKQFVVEMTPTLDPEVQTAVMDPETSVVRFFPLADRLNRPGVTLVGRATRAMGGRIVPKNSTWEDESNIQEKNNCMIKSYWPESQRESEVEIMKKVKAAAEGENDNDKLYEFIRKHVPEMYCYLKPEFLGSSTATIRRFLKLASGQDDSCEIPGARHLLLIVFKRLYGIQGLCEDEMIKFYIETYFCHRALWLSGIYHSDVSLGNIMWDKEFQTGVLNDFDLARLFGSKGATGHENTGTLPFMAIDLLNPDGMAGLIPRRYRHDAEAFVWVLVYLCLAFTRKGDRVIFKDDNPLADWSDETMAAAAKTNIAAHYNRILLQSPASYPSISDMAYDLASDAIDKYRARYKGIVKAERKAVQMGKPLSSVYFLEHLPWEEVDADIWTSMIDILETHLKDGSGGDLLEELKKRKGYARLSRHD